IQSHQFTFFVGQEGKAIVVHAAAISATSQQLDALINGGMEESETRCARLEDVQVDDFIRFCEYAYRGDYTVPPWEHLPPEASSEPEKNQQSGSEADPAPEPDIEPIEPVEIPEARYEVTPTRTLSRTTLRAQFNGRKYLGGDGPKALMLEQFEPKSNSGADQNFTPVFLAHARLYCFAYIRLIAPLKALTLDKLHRTLMGFKLYTKRVGDIIELVRYVYSNPDLPDRSDNGQIDGLKNLVVEYIVCEIDWIGRRDEFLKYMEEGGEFVGDFWRLARDYIS
ncbi:hypothetical protein P154DRAFT_448023, partial [Amniculicola lignicola CBS 123094]